jgi:hypothetical protein
LPQVGLLCSRLRQGRRVTAKGMYVCVCPSE